MKKRSTDPSIDGINRSTLLLLVIKTSIKTLNCLQINIETIAYLTNTYVLRLLFGFVGH